jgi:plasmid replication initiation protein
MSLVKITKSNYLIEASYNLTLQEQRLILACLSKVNSTQEAKKEISLSASEYSELMNINIKNAHRELYGAAEKLYERSVIVSDPEKTEEFRWIQKKVVYHKGDGRITLTWSDDVLGYISQLKRRFTTYRLADVANLNTSYAIRLYELLMQFNSTKQRYISLDDFRSLFQLEDKYPLFRDLNKRVIKPAVKEINDSSNLIVYYSTKKKGKNVIALEFDFVENNQLSMNFN